MIGSVVNFLLVFIYKLIVFKDFSPILLVKPPAIYIGAIFLHRRNEKRTLMQTYPRRGVESGRHRKPYLKVDGDSEKN